MTNQNKETWKPTDQQVDQIILLAMQGIAQQYAGYINELQWPPEFIAVMLRYVADAFVNPSLQDESSCDCC